MSDNPADALQRFARGWECAGKYLKEERAARLRNMTDLEARRIIAHIFSRPAPAKVARTSGLIEQQRLFRKLK